MSKHLANLRAIRAESFSGYVVFPESNPATASAIYPAVVDHVQDPSICVGDRDGRLTFRTGEVFDADRCLSSTAPTVPCDRETLGAERAGGESVAPRDVRLDGNDKLTPFGRPTVIAQFGLTEEFFILCQRLYTQLNRTKAGGSYALAVRLAVRNPICPPAFRAYIEAQPDRQYLPPSLKHEIKVAKAVIEHHRSPTEAVLNSVYTPGVLRKHPKEDRGLRAGEMCSSDDGSVNFLVQVPWPMRGCPCSERYGVKVGRFQALPVLDCGSGFAAGVSWVVRPAQSYRAEDIVASLGHTMRQVGIWEMGYFERGSWEADRTNEFLSIAGVERLTAYQPRQKLIEQWWSPTWTHLSLLPGQIGRFRGEEEESNKRLTAYQAGSRDPREELLTLTQAMGAFQKVLNERNHERIDAGPLFGSWIPAERWAADLAEKPMKPWPDHLDHLLRPERHELMVRNHMVCCTAVSPLGEKLRYMFFDEALIGLERQFVSVFFDPHRDPVTAAIFHRGTLVSAAATCISRAPAIIRRSAADFDLSWDSEHVARAEEAKKRARAWVRREHSAIAPDGSLKAWLSEQRGPDGATVASMEKSTGNFRSAEEPDAEPSQPSRGITAAPSRIRTDAQLEEEEVLANALEQRARERGLIPCDTPLF